MGGHERETWNGRTPLVIGGKAAPCAGAGGKSDFFAFPKGQEGADPSHNNARYIIMGCLAQGTARECFGNRGTERMLHVVSAPEKPQTDQQTNDADYLLHNSFRC